MEHKTSRRKYGQYSTWFMLRKLFFNSTPFNQELRLTIDKWKFIKQKCFYTAKEKNEPGEEKRGETLAARESSSQCCTQGSEKKAWEQQGLQRNFLSTESKKFTHTIWGLCAFCFQLCLQFQFSSSNSLNPILSNFYFQFSSSKSIPIFLFQF